MEAKEGRLAVWRGSLTRAGAGVLGKGVQASSFMVEEGLKAAGMGAWVTSHLLEGQVLPAVNALQDIRREVSQTLLDALEGGRPPKEAVLELAEKTRAGARYKWLVENLGREIFGSARYAGERVLARNQVFKLSYLPPKAGVEVQPFALFHAGGFIPFGDRLFRLLPEANFFDRFLERGIGVYAMELLGTSAELGDVREVSLEQQIDMIDELSALAFQHAGGKKLVAEGYCGTAMPLIAFMAARPREADARFWLSLNMVAPIDAKKCLIFGEMQRVSPKSLSVASRRLSRFQGSYATGMSLWAGLDISLKNVFVKTDLGRFAAGWRSKAYARVRSSAELTPGQRIELAGAYWISIHNCLQSPIPEDLVRFHGALFDQGVGQDGLIPARYRGMPLSFQTILNETRIPFVGFYGGQDRVVQEESGRVLGQILGERYTHIVHPNAGHVSYIFTPGAWKAEGALAVKPNPIDLILERYAQRKDG